MTIALCYQTQFYSIFFKNFSKSFNDQFSKSLSSIKTMLRKAYPDDSLQNIFGYFVFIHTRLILVFYYEEAFHIVSYLASIYEI